jgi:uncharacterized protein
MKPKVVIDTNIFVAHFFGKTSRKIVALWRQEKMVLLVTHSILGEYFEILSRFRFRKELQPLLDLFDEKFNMEMVEVTDTRRLVPDDPQDDKFLHCALEGRADALVSGDEHLLRVKPFYRDVLPIVPASEFFKKIWPELENKG